MGGVESPRATWRPSSRTFPAREKSPALSKLCLKTKTTLEREWAWLFLKIRKTSFLHAAHLYQDPREPGRSPSRHAKLHLQEEARSQRKWDMVCNCRYSQP